MPTTYNREFDFTGYQTAAPSAPLPASHIDAELNRLKVTTDSLIASLALIQRADGEIANASIGADQLSAQLIAGVNPATAWLTATAYTTSDYVFHTQKLYHCLVAHTSGTFATDLAAVKWLEISDFTVSASGATTSLAGIAELATDAEAIAKADTVRTITPSNLAALAASDVFAGFIELATDAETRAQVVTNRAVTPANLAARAAFSANKSSSDQAVAGTTWVKLTFGTESFDVGGHFGSNKWTPPPGVAVISAGIGVLAIDDGEYAYGALYKNGSIHQTTQLFLSSADGAGVAFGATWVVQCNGTDYFEAYVYASGAATVSGDSTLTYFSGAII